MKTSIVTLIAIVALVGGAAGGYFFRNYQLQRSRPNFAGGNFRRIAGPNANGGGMNRGVIGSILSMDDKSLTVKMPDGSSKIVLFADSTRYTNSVSAGKGDLKVGENVAVFGTPNTDGSVTAEDIQINPQFFNPTPSPAGK